MKIPGVKCETTSHDQTRSKRVQRADQHAGLQLPNFLGVSGAHVIQLALELLHTRTLVLLVGSCGAWHERPAALPCKLQPLMLLPQSPQLPLVTLLLLLQRSLLSNKVSSIRKVLQIVHASKDHRACTCVQGSSRVSLPDVSELGIWKEGGIGASRGPFYLRRGIRQLEGLVSKRKTSSQAKLESFSQHPASCNMIPKDHLC